MTDNRVVLLSELFDAALDLDEGGRESFIAARCAGDVELEAELRRLLMRHRCIEGKRTRSPLDIAAEQLEPVEIPVLVADQMLGPYRIDKEIGRGGMGRVFRATRSDGAFSQDVAIKVVRRDHMNPALLKRFSTERAILATLDHPGISRLLDASSLADGTPYVVMELVRGEHITDYCDTRCLSTKQRVALFRKVLAAVSHAHRNLIVHRDIKDSNVLVTAEGQPKLLDFGVAKPLTEIELGATATADRFFTPSHAAPEQLLGGPVTIGCDVYSLGVLLYELLAAHPPFEFEGLSAGQIEHLIVAVPPPAMASGIDVTDIDGARRHGARDTGEWRRQISGDLEAITQRALRKEPGERYVTIEQFDSDLASYLAERPVAARGTQRWYRARKFAARNRAATAFGVVAFLALSATVFAISVQNVALKHARDRVTQERDRAALELDRAQFAVEFLSDAFTQADPAQVGGADVTARTILEGARTRVGTLQGSQPDLYISLAASLAKVHLALGLANEAADLSTQARRVAQRNGTTVQSLADLHLLEAEALANAGRYEQARYALDWLERRGHASSTEWRFVKARLLTLSGHPSGEAIVLLRRAVSSTADSRPGDDQANQIRWQFAETLRMAKQPKAGLRVLDQTLAWQRAGLPASHPRITLTRIRRVDHMRALKRFDDAVEEAAHTVPDVEKHYGENSSMTALARNSLGNALRDKKRLSEAADALAGAVISYRLALGETHSYTMQTEFNLGQLLRQLPSREAEAEERLRIATGNASKVLGDVDPLTVFFRMNLAEYLLEKGRANEALAELATESSLLGASAADPFNRQEYARLLDEAAELTPCKGGALRSSQTACVLAARFRFESPAH